jgi:hypothetical protein
MHPQLIDGTEGTLNHRHMKRSSLPVEEIGQGFILWNDLNNAKWTFNLEFECQEYVEVIFI